MWLFFFPQFLVDGRDSQEVKGMILSLYLIVAEILVHVVSFISLGMLREKKGQTFNCFFFFFFLLNIFILSSFTSIAYSHQRSCFQRNTNSWWYLQNIYSFYGFSSMWTHGKSTAGQILTLHCPSHWCHVSELRNTAVHFSLM